MAHTSDEVQILSCFDTNVASKKKKHKKKEVKIIIAKPGMNIEKAYYKRYPATFSSQAVILLGYYFSNLTEER